MGSPFLFILKEERCAVYPKGRKMGSESLRMKDLLYIVSQRKKERQYIPYEVEDGLCISKEGRWAGYP
jgi:hypothetical protein